MACTVNPWILKKVKSQFGEAEAGQSSRRQAVKPSAQFVEALRSRNPYLPAGHQCTFNDKEHTIYGVITDGAVKLMVDDINCPIQRPFTVPKLKGNVLKLVKFELKTYISPVSAEHSGFVLVVDEVRVVCPDKVSVMGDPVWIEEDPFAKSVVLRAWKSARERERLVSAGPEVLATLDQGFSQAQLAPGWNAEPEELLKAINFEIHPEEREALDAVQPPDGPCSLPSVEEAAEGVDESLGSNGTQRSPARHFSHQRSGSSTKPDSQSILVSGSAVPKRNLRSKGMTTVGAADITPVGPSGSADPCDISHQAAVDMAGASACSSGSTVQESSGQNGTHVPEAREGAPAESDNSSRSSNYETASEKEYPAPSSPQASCVPVSEDPLDSPSIKLRRPPRRLTSKRVGASSSEKARNQLTASEVQLNEAFMNKSAVQQQMLHPEYVASGSGQRNSPMATPDRPQTSESQRRKAAHPQKLVTSEEAIPPGEDDVTGTSKRSSSSPPLFSSNSTNQSQPENGISASQSSDCIIVSYGRKSPTVAQSEYLFDSNPFDTQHMVALRDDSADCAEYHDRLPASMEIVDNPNSQPMARYQSHFARSPSPEDQPESNPFDNPPVGVQYAGSGRELATSVLHPSDEDEYNGPSASPPAKKRCRDGRADAAFVARSGTSNGRSPDARSPRKGLAMASGPQIPASVQHPVLNADLAARADNGGSSSDVSGGDHSPAMSHVLLIREINKYSLLGKEAQRGNFVRGPDHERHVREAIQDAIDSETRFWVHGIYDFS